MHDFPIPRAISLYRPGGRGGVIVNAAKSGRDEWASGNAYEPYVGRWSRLVARVFLNWLSVPAKGSWLDIGCGTGALSQTILELTDPAHIRGVDRSQGYIDFARGQLKDPRVLFEVGDAQALPVASECLQCGGVRLGPEFHASACQYGCRDEAGSATGRNSRRVRLGLCRENAVHSAFLGCRGHVGSCCSKAG